MYLLRLCQLPPLYTFVNPFDCSIDLADRLRMPEAQQVIITWSFLNLASLPLNVFNGMFTEVRKWPPENSAGVRTSIILAPPAINASKSAPGVKPNNCFKLAIKPMLVV